MCATGWHGIRTYSEGVFTYNSIQVRNRDSKFETDLMCKILIQVILCLFSYPTRDLANLTCDLGDPIPESIDQANDLGNQISDFTD